MKYAILMYAAFVTGIAGESIRGELKSEGDTTDKSHHINALYNQLEDKCLPKDMTLESMIERTQTILNYIQRYTNLVENKKKLREKLEFMIEETKDSTQVHDLVSLLKSDINGSCLMGAQGGCDETKQHLSGVYDLSLNSEVPYKAYCNMEVDGGRWTVIQRRQTGSTNFQKTWEEYKNGFGDLNGDFWLGNDLLHQITSSGRYELRVDISDWSGTSWYALYKTFRIGSESDKYKLTVGGYSGTAGDSLKYHNGKFFSTKDRDNDESGQSCSHSYGEAGWWYKSCHESNLNGLLQEGSGAKGMTWYILKNKDEAMQTSRMMIRKY